MSWPQASRRFLPVTLLAAVPLLALAGSPAGAQAATPTAAPAWEVHVVARPSSFSPADAGPCEEHATSVFNQLRPCDGYTVVLRNSGAAPSSEPVTVTQALAGPVKPLYVAGEELQRGALGANPTSCSEAPLGQSVSCTYSEPIPPDGALSIQLNLTASGSGQAADSVLVQGGGAASETASASTAITGEGAPFGFSDYTMAVTGPAGGADTQAGAHPYELSTHFDFATACSCPPTSAARGAGTRRRGPRRRSCAKAPTGSPSTSAPSWCP